MKTLTPEQLATVQAQVTGPRYLMEIELDEPRYWSTREPTEWNGNLFEMGYLRMGNVSNEQANFAFFNEDYVHTNNALNGVYMRRSVRIWWAYGPAKNGGVHYVNPGYWDEGYTISPEEGDPEPILKFEGMIFATPEINKWITVMARQTPPKRYPSPRLKPPFANHLPSAGYTVQFDSTALTIEGSR